MKENNENDLISRRALYDKCVELEQEALKIVQTVDDKIEKLIWNAVLTERSAFKFSVMDAPASLSNPSAEREKSEWVRNFDGNEWHWYCSNCKEKWNEEDLWMGGNDFPNYCPNCGAEMRGE